MNIFTKLSLTNMLAVALAVNVNAQTYGPHLQDVFEGNPDNLYTWTAATGSATLSQNATTGVLTMTTGVVTAYNPETPETPGKFRGDFKKNGVTAIDMLNLNPATYPIVAIKMTSLPSGNQAALTFDAGSGVGSYGNGSNKYTGALDVGNGRTVYYYDLSASGKYFGSGTANPTNVTRNISTFQFKVADILSYTTTYSYEVDWVQTFASLDELKLSANLAVSNQRALGWNKRVDLSWKKELSTITSCNVYRSNNESGPFTQIASGITTTSYQDNDASLTNGTTYYYQIRPVVNGSEAALGTTFSAVPKEDVAFTDWNHGDIGNTIGIAGNAGFSTGGTFTISAAGADIWKTNDGFHYAYKELSADGYITAKINSLLNTQASAKAGVMIREGLGNNSRKVLASFTPAFGAEFGYTTTGSETKYDKPITLSGTAGTYSWVRLVRSGAVITAYYSVDGNTWEEGPSATFTEESALKNADVPVYIGVFALSHDVNKLTTATFSNIVVVEGTLPVSLTIYTAKLKSNGQVNLNWAVSSENNNSYFLVERKSADGDFTQLEKISSKGNGEAVYAYTDANAIAGINYYRLSQVDLNGRQTELGLRSVNVSLTNSQQLSVFPNPIINNQFSFTYNQSGSTVLVKIIDLAGKTVFSQIVKGNNGLFNISTPAGIKPGIYILEVDQAIKQKVVFK